MFFSCPHCRELVATDRETRLPPEMCPRCGGVLQDAGQAKVAPASAVVSGTSFASFLRGADTAGSDLLADEPAPEVAVQTPRLDEQEALEVDTALSSEAADHPGMLEDAAAAPLATPILPNHIATPPVPQAAALSHDHAPSFMRTPGSMGVGPGTAKWQWAAVLVLAVSLLTQVLVADRARLATDAAWRPTIVTLCGLLGCSVPSWHQPGAISMLSRDVSPIAGSNGGLDVSATFRNDARWSQPWPVLLLSLSDADGRVLGSRAFLPAEYLGPDATQTELSPGQSARIALKLREPNPGVVAFSFDFR